MNSQLDLQSLCRRLEFAQAAQNQAMAEAQARMNPESHARCVRIGDSERGAFAVYLGPGHMLNQGLALGLDGPLPEAALDEMEAVLGRPTVLEVSAGADPGLYPTLSKRGYRIQMFQQVWMRELEDLPPTPAPDVRVRPLQAGEAKLFASVVAAGFFERDELNEEGLGIMLPTTQAMGTTCFLAFMEGEPMGAGTLGLSHGVAALSGTSVRPKFRGRGGQGALIQARLAFAKERGCDVACSATMPHGPSQFNLQKMGFRAAYPKLELVREI
ncbi:MAG: GNAT family N-acetyltransferase [Acidobacteriota bacterium]|nr:GNAT family N-acetyltransferase [Acidobacteriota bacterium]